MTKIADGDPPQSQCGDRYLATRYACVVCKIVPFMRCPGHFSFLYFLIILLIYADLTVGSKSGMKS